MRKSAVVAAALCLGGCLSMPVNPRYAPAPMAKPWEGRKPKVYLGTVSDKSNGIVIGAYKVTTLRPLEEVLREAFIAEFARLGIPVAKTIAEADLQVTAQWKEAGVKIADHFIVFTSKAMVKIGLTVKTPSNAILYNEDITGRADGSRGEVGGLSPAVQTGALSGALGDAMARVSELFMTEIPEQMALAESRGGLAQAVPAAPEAVRSDVDELPKARLPVRRAHAVVIGVERYRQQLPAADFAASDARLVAKYLTQTMGFPAENVAVLTNDGATRGDLEKYLDRWLANRVEPGDSVFVYYSGHGSPNPATGDAYLVPFDGDPMYLDQTAYSVQRLYAGLAKLPTKDVTVVLDSCFSGAGGRSVLAKGARPLVSVQTKANIPEELTVLSAAAGNQISQSYQVKGHGLFTYFFLKALAKQAASGTFDMKQVYDSAAPEVSRVARQDYNTEQQPQWHGGSR